MNETTGGEKYLLCYTRTPMEDDIYSAKLAYSMHLALIEEDRILPLNHNSGILYCKAEQNADGTLHAWNLKNPRIYQAVNNGTENASAKEGGCPFYITAERVNCDGSKDTKSEGKVLLFTSTDLIYYEEKGLYPAEELQCFLRTDSIADGEEAAERKWETLLCKKELPEGAVVGNVIAITQEQARRLKVRFVTPHHVGTELPECAVVHHADDLKNVKAVCRYSDGSFAEKRVDWEMDTIDWKMPGTYWIEGRIHQDHYEFPIAFHRADPCIGKWKGKYYFLATNDRDHEHTMYIRCADTIPGLVTAKDVKILDAYTYPHIGNLLWAPEFHIIRGELYIFFAATPERFEDEQCHIMKLKTGGNPMKESDWEEPVRVVKKDGSPLFTSGITLDMTEFERDTEADCEKEYYVCWSQRQFEPVDQGAWLYIAKLNPEKPWQLLSDPVLLSMPEYSWANNHTFVDEGPFVLKRNGRIYMTFSSAAVDSTYVVGILSADLHADLLDPNAWTKENYPILSSRSVEGEYGTGHNSYIEDEDGQIWNAYHGRPGVDAPRSSGIRRVHFNAEGFPVLDMTEELDVAPEQTWVRMKIEYRTDKAED